MMDDPFVYHNPGDIVAEDKGWWWCDPVGDDLDYGPYENSALAAKAMLNFERQTHGNKRQFDGEPHPRRTWTGIALRPLPKR